MPASPNDPQEWDNFSWSHEQIPSSNNSSSSSSSTASSPLATSSPEPDERNVHDHGLLVAADLIAENVRLRRELEASEAARHRASGKLYLYEWWARNQGLPRREHHGVMRMVVMVVWRGLVRVQERVQERVVENLEDWVGG